MIKGAFIFAGGLVVGTGYGFFMGLRLTKAFEKIAESVDTKADEVVTGETVPPAEAEVSV